MVNDLINIAQVGLTVTFFGLVFLLIKTWSEGFKTATSKHYSRWSAEQWLIVGIVLGFAGGLLDQIYWGVHWLTMLYHHPWQPWLLEHGPLSNLFARQLTGIVSVYCHLRAAQGMAGGVPELQDKSFMYCLLGVTTAVFLCVTVFL